MKEHAELGLTGKGVEPLRIAQIDRCAKQYLLECERADEASKREDDAAEALVDALHEHAGAIRQPDGSLMYRFNEKVISLVVGNEKLKVKNAGAGK